MFGFPVWSYLGGERKGGEGKGGVCVEKGWAPSGSGFPIFMERRNMKRGLQRLVP